MPPSPSNFTIGGTWLSQVRAGIFTKTSAAMLFLAMQCGGATENIEWKWKGGPLSSVFFADGEWAASGSVNLISFDALNWNLQSQDVDWDIRLLGKHAGIWVAMGRSISETAILTSSDLRQWSVRSRWNTQSGSHRITSITFEGGRWIAVWSTGGGDYTIATSTDLVEWNTVTNDSYYTRSQIRYLNGRWIVGGIAYILTSTNGLIWTQYDISNESVYDIAHGNGVWVAAGKTFSGNGILYTTTNGVSWTRRTMPPSASTIRAITYADGIFVTVGDLGQVFSSPDGTNWSRRALGVTSHNLASVKYGNGCWVAVGAGSIITSLDAVNWKSAASIIGTGLTDIKHANGRWVSVGQPGKIITSTNLINWTDCFLEPTVAPSQVWNSLQFGSDVWLAFGTSIQRSRDGINWKTDSSPPFVTKDAAFFDGLWLATGQRQSGVSEIIRSNDSTNWVTAHSDSGSLDSIGYGNGKWVAVGRANNKLVTSPDGTNWTARLSGGYGLSSVAWGNGRWLAVGSVEAWTSTDGDTWNKTTINTNTFIDTIRFVGNRWFAFGYRSGYGILLTSNDGIQWGIALHVADLMRDISYANGRWVAIGASGTVLEAGVEPQKQLRQISIQGPTTIQSRSVGTYKCIAEYSNGSTEDVSSSPEAKFFANPFIGTTFGAAQFVGNRLYTEVDGNSAQFWISATYQDSTGGKSSSPIFVSITPGFSVQIEATHKDAQVNEMAYTSVTLRAIPSDTLDSSITYRWDVGDDDGQFNNGTGEKVTRSFLKGRTHLVGVETTRANPYGITTSRLYLTLDKQKGDPNEPDTKCATDIFSEALRNVRGEILSLTDLTNAANGLIVIIHGLCAAATDDWVMNMGIAIEARLHAEGIPVPAIVLYDWKRMANPDAFEGSSSSCPPTFWRISDEIISQDIKNYGMAHGAILADWIGRQVEADVVKTNKPIHLIGHSAGGFVAGECAIILNQLNNGSFGNPAQITMLDTPHPVRRHVTELKKSVRVERYIGSCFGSFAPWVDGTACSPRSFPIRDCNEFLLDLASQKQGLIYWCRSPVEPDSSYHRAEIPNAPDDPVEAHDYSHQWYLNTIVNAEREGFWYSPWLNNQFPETFTTTRLLGLDNPDSIVVLDSFTIFGNVTVSNGTYIVREEGNAGIFTNIALPIGAETLRFRYRFITHGDGDFLSVHWGSNVVLYVGVNTLLSEQQFINAEVIVPGMTNEENLVFKLVSRGHTNATLLIEGIEVSVNDDPDGDGATTTLEWNTRTSPLKADTDEDGISDGDEVSTNPVLRDTDGDGMSDGDEVAAGTNPLLVDSALRITSVQFVASSIMRIHWQGISNHAYRLNRAESITRDNYEVLTNFVFETTSSNLYFDVATTNKTAFFWIETDH